VYTSIAPSLAPHIYRAYLPCCRPINTLILGALIQIVMIASWVYHQQRQGALTAGGYGSSSPPSSAAVDSVSQKSVKSTKGMDRLSYPGPALMPNPSKSTTVSSAIIRIAIRPYDSRGLGGAPCLLRMSDTRLFRATGRMASGCAWAKAVGGSRSILLAEAEVAIY
jgi:hypothetical protein